MLLMQHLAIVALWNTGSFDTAQIAELLHVAEADVANAVALIRDAERGLVLEESVKRRTMCVVLPFGAKTQSDSPMGGGAA